METMTTRAGGASARSLSSQVRWTYIAPTLLVIWIITNFDKANMAIVMNDKSFLADFGLAGHQAKLGWLSSGLFLAYGLSSPVWGWVVDRIGPKKTAVISCLMWALTCFWSGFATDYTSLLLSRVALGVGEGALYPLTLAVVSRWFALRERGRATSFWWIGTMIGPMFTGLLVTSLILAVGWRWQFAVLGLLALLFPLPMILMLTTDRPEQHPKVSPAEAELISQGSLENNEDAPGRALKTVHNVWTSYRYWLTTIAMTSNAIFFWGWAIWLPTYLRTTRHFSFSTSGYLTFVIYGFAVLTILTIGFVSDRIFRRALLAGIGWILAAAFLVSAALAPAPWLSVVLTICALCAQQTGISCAEMLMHSLVVASKMGRMQGVRSFVSQTVSSLSPAAIGYIVQRTGGFEGAFIVLAGAVAIAAGCMIALAIEGL
jgi:sugar phosphate permease